MLLITHYAQNYASIICQGLVCIYLYIILCVVQGPEVAGTALKQIQYIGEGGGGVAELQVACEAHIQGRRVLGHPPEKNNIGEFRPSYTRFSL